MISVKKDNYWMCLYFKGDQREGEGADFIFDPRHHFSLISNKQSTFGR